MRKKKKLPLSETQAFVKYPDNSTDILNVGDTVTFLRQGVGYPNKQMTGKIIQFGYSPNSGDNKVAGIKVEDCEYGSALPFNHTQLLPTLRKVV